MYEMNIIIYLYNNYHYLMSKDTGNNYSIMYTLSNTVHFAHVF